MTVIIVRGLPGSGKSSWAKKNFPDAVVVSADDHFMVGGGYRYDHSKIEAAHEDCFEKFWYAVKDGRSSTVIVDNVFQRLWQISPYMKVAQFRGHDVQLVRCYTEDPFTSWERNTHGVPRDKFGFVVKAFDKAPKAWKEKRICTG